MIWESSFWKEPLLLSADYFVRVRMNERTSEKTMVRMEKEMFLGFYAIRKLTEAHKITDTTGSQEFDLMWHPARRRVDLLNWHRIDENYDLESQQVEQRDLMFLCNQFIHSFLFVVAEDLGRLGGVYVASDRERHKKCYFIKRDQIVRAFRSVAKDDLTEAHYKRDPITGQFNVRAS